MLVRDQIDSLALPSRCGTPSNITRTAIRFDDRKWFNRTGTPLSDEADYWSVVTHELGHATGFGDALNDHFGGNTLCPSGDVNARQTMWESAPANATAFRTLEDHDERTFDDHG